MERLALIGVSHRRGGANALEAWQTTFADGPLAAAAAGFSEWIPIVTCNRWELVLALPPDMRVEEARDRFIPTGQSVKPYAYLGDGALEHLCRVAASLDSLNPGEDQIMAQVRRSYEEAQQAGTTGKVTSFAFHTALRIAKKVRREVALAPLNTSLFSLAKPELLRRLDPGAEVAVLGAGEMGALAAKSLVDQGGLKVIIVNRSVERARQLGKHLGIPSLSLERFMRQPPRVAALVCATPVAGLVDEVLVAKLPQLQAVVDLGVPRNVAPGLKTVWQGAVFDVDSLKAAGLERRQDLAAKLAEAEATVQDALELALTEWTERRLGPSIKRLRDWYLETIGDALPEEEAQRLAHKFAHVPVKGLRALAREHGFEAAQTFLAETGLES